MIAALSAEREIIQHPTTKDTATELHWLRMLGGYLPKRYCADNAFILDCEGNLTADRHSHLRSAVFSVLV